MEHPGTPEGLQAAVQRRLRQHQTGARRSSSLTRAAVAADIAIELVRVWPDATRQDEKAMKKSARSAAWCPYCKRAYLDAARDRMRTLRAQRAGRLAERAVAALETSQEPPG